MSEIRLFETSFYMSLYRSKRKMIETAFMSQNMLADTLILSSNADLTLIKLSLNK